MEHTINNMTIAAILSCYRDFFWKALRGSDAAYADMSEAKYNNTGTFMLPAKTASKYAAALKRHNLFRQRGTVLTETARDSKIYISNNDARPEWVPENEPIPTTEDNSFPPKDVSAHKLAIVTALQQDFVSDIGFDLESYLIGRFSKAFGKAEEDAFINGTGVSMPRGILHDTDGAETGVTVTGSITFDDVLALYFSVDRQYRSDGAWLMNDETALKLKTLKDANGQYLWNQNSDTVLGKPVLISEFMPSEGKPIAFGDFSYYYIVDRLPLTVRTLHQLFAMQQKVGFLGVELLDGLLIRPEAVKVLRVSE